MKYAFDRSIVNLLANACRFTVEGCIKLSISKVPDKVSAEEWIQFTVSDTGTGCEQEDASQAFEPYFSTSESVRAAPYGFYAAPVTCSTTRCFCSLAL